MNLLLVFLHSTLFLLSLSRTLYPAQLHSPLPSEDCGEPLFLSKYLNDPQTAQNLAKVTLDGYDYPSYSGYITVNETFNSNSFFWFFPAQNGKSDAPILMWLQGGPGGSSLYGLFVENGPFSVDVDNNLVPRETSWNKNYHIFFVDNPVGTGFSFTENDDGYAKEQSDVANQLYSFLEQFFTIFPQYVENDFYITGESYAGKYIPNIATAIHNNNKNNPKIHINMKGISIGDGAIDPEIQFTGFSDFLYNLGLFDDNQRIAARIYESKIQLLIRDKQWIPAFRVFDEFLNGDQYHYGTFFNNCTGLTNYFNLAGPEYPPDPYSEYLTRPSIRKAIHVGDKIYNDGSVVEAHILSDWMKPSKYLLPTLMNNYKVLIYSGQYDLILGAALTENSLKTISWDNAEDYHAALKKIWKVKNQVAGYVTKAGKFTYVVVRDAGHMIPLDQPDWAFELITNFIDDKEF